MGTTELELDETLSREMRDQAEHLKGLPEDRELTTEDVVRLEEMRSAALELVRAIEGILLGIEGRPRTKS